MHCKVYHVWHHVVCYTKRVIAIEPEDELNVLPVLNDTRGNSDTRYFSPLLSYMT